MCDQLKVESASCVQLIFFCILQHQVGQLLRAAAVIGWFGSGARKVTFVGSLTKLWCWGKPLWSVGVPSQQRAVGGINRSSSSPSHAGLLELPLSLPPTGYMHTDDNTRSLLDFTFYFIFCHFRVVLDL